MEGGVGTLPFSVVVMGTIMVPVLVTLTGLVNNVVVVVNTIVVVKLSTTLDTTTSTVGTKVVNNAFVIVVTGIEPVPAGAENTDRVALGGTAVEDPKGLGPATMFTGPDCAMMSVELLTLTHWKMSPILLSTGRHRQGYPGGRDVEKRSWPVETSTAVSSAHG